MENNKQKQQQQQHPDNSDSDKKESTNSGGNDDSPSTASSKPKDIIHEDLCSICFDDVSILDPSTFTTCFECGKVMHMKCSEQLRVSKGLSFETRHSCPVCRAPFISTESKKQIERLQKWLLLGKSWAQFALGSLYHKGLGVNKDTKRACKLYTLAVDQGHHLAHIILDICMKMVTV